MKCAKPKASAAATLAAFEPLGFNVTQVYGLTETYGPATECTWFPENDTLQGDARAARKAAYEGWLTELALAERMVATTEDGDPQFEVINDSSVNSQADVDAGIQRDLVRIKLIAKNLVIQLRVEIGTDVTITDAA